jgi:Flp pilus assembly protein TadG
MKPVRFANQSIRTGGRGERGGATVEFALVFVLLFSLLGLIVQGALVFNAWMVIENAVREGARRGAPCYQRPVNSCNATWVINEVRKASGGVQEDAANLTVYVQTSGNLLVVGAFYNVPVLVPFLGPVLGTSIPLSVESRMRLESS